MQILLPFFVLVISDASFAPFTRAQRDRALPSLAKRGLVPGTEAMPVSRNGVTNERAPSSQTEVPRTGQDHPGTSPQPQHQAQTWPKDIQAKLDALAHPKPKAASPKPPVTPLDQLIEMKAKLKQISPQQQQELRTKARALTLVRNHGGPKAQVMYERSLTAHVPSFTRRIFLNDSPRTY